MFRSILCPSGTRRSFGISSSGNGQARACPDIELRVTGKGFTQIARFFAHGRAGRRARAMPDASLITNKSTFECALINNTVDSMILKQWFEKTLVQENTPLLKFLIEHHKTKKFI